MDLDDIINGLAEDDLNYNVVEVAINELAENQALRLLQIEAEDRNIPVRNTQFYENIVRNYNLDEFHDHFRMTRNTFQLLLNNVGANMRPYEQKIPLEKKLLFTVWFLAKQESFLATGDRFDFAKGTAHLVFFEIIQIISNFRQDYIQWPNDIKRQQISREFETKCGISGIVGAIDGCHIEIKAPTNNPVDFYNRNNYHSIILQAVCDNNMIFTDIFVGCPGRMHDARVFQLSPLHQRLIILPHIEHLLGDAAYPLLINLMKPYRDNGHLNDVQTLYNIRLSSARSTIERAFGQLKGKFRRLKYLDMSRADMIPVVVTAACVLHNFIIIHDKNVNADFEDIDVLPADDYNNDAHDHHHGINAMAAEQKRNALAASLQ